jgi:hypothetical protein
LREREDVNGLDLFLKLIVKFLGEGDAGELAADVGFDVSVFERAFGSRLAVTAYRLQRALRDAASTTPKSLAGTRLTNAIAMARKIAAQINESNNLCFITSSPSP